MLASCPASMLNQIRLNLGIPFDSFLSHLALVVSRAVMAGVFWVTSAARA
jgi:hypothetical protein